MGMDPTLQEGDSLAFPRAPVPSPLPPLCREIPCCRPNPTGRRCFLSDHSVGGSIWGQRGVRENPDLAVILLSPVSTCPSLRMLSSPGTFPPLVHLVFIAVETTDLEFLK